MSSIMSSMPRLNGAQQSPNMRPPVEIPTSDNIAGLPRKDRQSAKAVADWMKDQYDKALAKRRGHTSSWTRVMSIMRGIHYFDMVGTRWIPLKPDKKKIRAIYPVMKPAFRRFMGTLASNQLGVTATPKTGSGRNAFYAAQRAQAIMEQWIEEARVHDVQQDWSQHLAFYGMSAINWYADAFRQQVFIEAWPATELFPIPYDARNWRDMDGLMRRVCMPKAWLEQQDEEYERTHPGQQFDRMASLASSRETDFLGQGIGDGLGGKHDGAEVSWVWMKPNKQMQQGEMMLFVDDRMMRHEAALPGGIIPAEPTYYVKTPNDWWGSGFCEDQIAPQMESNRQYSIIVKQALQNKRIVVYNTDMIDPKHVQDQDSALIPCDFRSGLSNSEPIREYNGGNVTRDVGVTLELALDASKRAAGWESDILSGQQEKRTDSAAATNTLLTQAQAPMVPVLDGIWRSLKRIYPRVLDLIRETWPDNKTIEVVGRQNIGREFLFARDQTPASTEVILSPTPLLANGTAGMVSLLFQLRGMPADDGKGAVIKENEFRRSLSMMGYNPPGIEIYDKTEQRILYRITQIINDGQQPGGPPFTSEESMENHALAINLFKEVILDPSYQTYKPPVRKVLLQALQYHMKFMYSAANHPDKFDDDIEDTDAAAAEAYLDAAEQDLESLEGQMVVGGTPLGV